MGITSTNTNTGRQNPTSGSGFNITSMTGILNTLKTAFNIPTSPIPPLPPPLIMVGGNLRPGLSADAITGRIISRQSQANLPVGNVFSDGPNTNEAMIKIIVDEILSSILTESRVDVVIPPGVAVMTTGPGNLGVPVITLGTTTSMGVGTGIIR